MAEIKMTKNELRNQQNKLVQLLKYLPTLQLKKALLQLEVHNARAEILQAEEEYRLQRKEAEDYALLLSEAVTIDPIKVTQVSELRKRYENIAGVEVPYFEGVTFAPYDYSLLETPVWVDGVIAGLRKVATAWIKVQIAQEKKIALEKEWRQVSIRVNLFEKILIPRAMKHIKKIKIFLGDLQLAAVSQAKVAKRKIEERKAAFSSGSKR
jgi:V/A-type H+/Na+-transporting ATPase subunit D